MISVLSSYARSNTISVDCLLLKANKSASKRVVRAHTMHGLWLLQEGNYCNWKSDDLWSRLDWLLIHRLINSDNVTWNLPYIIRTTTFKEWTYSKLKNKRNYLFFSFLFYIQHRLSKFKPFPLSFRLHLAAKSMCIVILMNFCPFLNSVGPSSCL